MCKALKGKDEKNDLSALRPANNSQNGNCRVIPRQFLERVRKRLIGNELRNTLDAKSEKSEGRERGAKKLEDRRESGSRYTMEGSTKYIVCQFKC